MINLVHKGSNAQLSQISSAASELLAYASVTANAGDTLILIVRGFSQQGHVPSSISIAMNSPVAGLVWHQAGSIVSSANGWMACFYAANTPAFVATPTNYAIITVNIENDDGNLSMATAAAYEFSGLNAVSPYDTQSVGDSGSDSIPDAGSITPAGAGELIIASVIESVLGLYPPLIQAPGTSGDHFYTITFDTAGSVFSDYAVVWQEEYDSNCPSGAQTPAFALSSGVIGGQNVSWECAAWAFKS